MASLQQKLQSDASLGPAKSGEKPSVCQLRPSTPNPALNTPGAEACTVEGLSQPLAAKSNLPSTVPSSGAEACPSDITDECPQAAGDSEPVTEEPAQEVMRRLGGPGHRCAQMCTAALQGTTTPDRVQT